MIGLGVDLCEIKRIEHALEKSDAFLVRYFTDEERAYIAARGKVGVQSAAAMFAAKEAFVKAVGAGLSVPLSDVGVSHAPSGAPRYALTGKAAALMQELHATRAHLSLTHEAGMACAVAIIE